MKIVMITPYGKQDGVATYTSYLLKPLKKLVNVQIYPWNYSGIRKIFSPLSEFRKLSNALKTADLVHVQYAFGTYFFLFLPLLCVLRKKGKLALTLHEEYNNVPLSSLVRFWHCLFYGCADMLIVHTEASKNSLPVFLRGKTTVLPHGVVYREKTNRKPIKGQILLPGFINRWKGHDIAIRAISIAVKELPKVRLVIAGKAHDKKFFSEILMMIKKLRIEGHVEIREGYIPDEELYKSMRNSEIGLVPYRETTMSGIFCHMISWNLPTIVSDLPVFKEVTKNKGIYFKKGEPEDLARKIVRLLSDKRTQERLSREFNALAKEYSWENLARKTVSLYQK